jgi:hypothetical protein
MSDAKPGQQAYHGDGKGHYVEGHTNWDSYDLPELVSMVHDKVDIPALMGLADDWRAAGDQVVDAARGLGHALDWLMDFWSGAAAEQARTDVALNVQWVSDLGSTAHNIGDPVEEAAGALQAAQNQMPDIPVDAPMAGAAPDGAEAAKQTGGPVGASIGAVASGTDSAAEAHQQETELKRQAVETMRRFEQAAMSIDQTMPEFEGPSSTLHTKPKPTPPTTPPPATSAPPPGPGGKPPSWDALTRGDTAAQGSHGGGGGTHALPVSAGAGASASPGSPAGHGPQLGAGVGAGAMPVVERMPGAVPAAAGSILEADHGGAMGGGAPMAGGMGAGAGAGSGNDHRRRFPFEADDPFALDQKASPPVIGL